jgi:uncharacterized OsmC-like protein
MLTSSSVDVAPDEPVARQAPHRGKTPMTSIGTARGGFAGWISFKEMRAAARRGGQRRQHMSDTLTPAAPPAKVALNGVNTPVLLATINAVKGQPPLAQFQFRARNRWIAGTCTESTIETFSGAGGEHKHAIAFTYTADHPAVLVGEDRGPTPVEFLLHGLASCITSGIGNIAAARGVRLTSVESTIEGDIDLRGILGISDTVRNGYERIRINFEISGEAPPEKLRAIVEQARARSAVYDVLTNGVPVDVTVSVR